MRQTLLIILSLLLTAGPTFAQEAPKRKSGLWDITRTSTYTEDQPHHMRLCVDEASDNALLQLAEGMRGEACGTDKLSRDGDNLVVDATCKLRASTSQTHAVITGKFDSGYTIQSKSTYKPPLAGKAEGHAVLVAKWTGPCLAGQRPGETIMENGARVDSSGVAYAPKAKADSKDKNKNPTKDQIKDKKAVVPVPASTSTNPPVPNQ